MKYTTSKAVYWFIQGDLETIYIIAKAFLWNTAITIQLEENYKHSIIARLQFHIQIGWSINLQNQMHWLSTPFRIWRKAIWTWKSKYLFNKSALTPLYVPFEIILYELEKLPFCAKLTHIYCYLTKLKW